MEIKLEKTYNPKQVEDKIYDFWIEGNYFHAKPNPDKKPFTIVIPPPNITGQLHMGHALDNTLQDILIRYKRMKGFEALWLPGTDHAAIATEAKIVAALKAENLTKEELGREEFLNRAWEWKNKYGSRIITQLKKMGSSCDWERERFTMDEGCTKAVNEVFCRLYDKGLIYRGERMINWCPNCKTSISDAEVEYKDIAGSFWHIRYPLADGSGDVVIATTRPETMLGDTGLAINPNDEEKAYLIGKKVILPLVGREIPIVADDYVELGFGTGIVKMTPAHDPNDLEVARRHDLEIINILNEDGTINENGGKFAGMDRFACRKAVVKELQEKGYMVKIEDYSHNVGCCQRCGTIIEPMISTQWFVDMKPLAVPAVQAVKDKKTRFVPERFENTYFHFMENIRDWCISRQLWWGHSIPAWYCDDCGEITVSRTTPDKCSKCGSHHIHQDEDTLDTWFSSALWAFSTLGWPQDTEELKYFFPTNVLVTGYDIIFFWVARMIFSTLEQMGEVPFKDVLIHGLVRDAQGRKMSKSLGNGIDPLEIIDNYGADALRLTLATGNAPGNDMRFSDEKVRSSRNFCNKIWNAARFILMNIGDEEIETTLPENLKIQDKWVLAQLNDVIKSVTENIENYDLGIAVGKICDFIWDIFCDWYIEISKASLNEGGETAHDTKRVLVYVLGEALKLLHPFMPFITEEIWQSLPHVGETIMRSDYPEYNENLTFTEEANEFQMVMSAIRGIRNARANADVPPSRKATVYIKSDYSNIFKDSELFFQRLASADKVEIVDSDFDIEKSLRIVTETATILLPLNQLIDTEKELARLNKEMATCQKDVDFLSSKLSNEGFVNKAPEKVIQMEKDKLAKAEEKLAKIKESIDALLK